MPAEHKLLKFVLPSKAYAAVEAGTRKWLIECPCGYNQDLWDAGGVRYKGAGKPRQLMRCESCGKITLHTIRKK